MMNIWVIADDRTGNTHQAIALAEKLAEDYTLIKLQYNCLAKLPNFLLKYYPIHVKKKILQDIFDKPLPDIIITAGRRTAVLAFYLKKKFKDIKLIQIMQPNLPYNAFDAVILPYHDLSSNSQNVIPWLDQRHCEALDVLLHGSKIVIANEHRSCGNPGKIIKKCYKLAFFTGLLRRNLQFLLAMTEKPSHATKPALDVIPINGAINNVTDKFAAANLELQKHYPSLKQFIAVIIGGNNKKFNFDEKAAVFFSSLLNKIYTNQKIPFFISFSRRTPDTVKSIIKSNMPPSTIIYDPTEDTEYTADTSKVGSQISGEPAERRKLREQRRIPKFDVPNLEVSKVFNPYIAMLAKAKYIISTADSISMCSEAASSGKPLYIFYPPNFNSSKHKIFIKQLVEQKIARIFDESVISLEEYNYKPLNEAARVAEIIRATL